MKNFSYIDKYSWKSMLGKMSKNIIENDIYAKWEVLNKKHIIIFRPLKNEDLNWIEQYIPFSFHYFNLEDINLLKTKFKVKKDSIPSIYLDIQKTIDMVGKKYRGIRNRLNGCNANNIEVLDNYISINDIEEFVDKWSNEYSLKYFRDLSSKNIFFYSNNLHKDCINSFLYKDKKLIGYGTVSPPVNGSSIYIIGKAFYNLKNQGIIGLSEFLDVGLYKKAFDAGARYVNLGGSFSKSLKEYKRKFPGATEFIEYEGKVQ